MEMTDNCRQSKIVPKDPINAFKYFPVLVMIINFNRIIILIIIMGRNYVTDFAMADPGMGAHCPLTRDNVISTNPPYMN